MALRARALVIATATAVCAFALAASTAGAQVTVGQTVPDVPSLPNPCTYEGGWDEFQVSTPSGASYAVPSAGVITSWSHLAGEGLGQKLIFKVFRVTGGAYTVVGHDERALTPSTLNTFPVSIPVQAGDVLGLHVFDDDVATPPMCSYYTGDTRDAIEYQETNAPDGLLTPIEARYDEYRLNVSATLLPPPTLTGITPAKGSVAGGAKVVIAGTNFASVSAVSFGSVLPTAYTVDSEGQITATAPKSKTLSKVPVTVTTAAGVATSATTFAYEGCKVPKLKGKKLKASKKKLKKSDCKAGKVKKKGEATAKTGEVVGQSPKPGKILAPGAKVKVTLGA